MKDLIHEIHRRSLWQVLGIYTAGSWVAFQVVKELQDTAVLPDWVPTFALILLVIGFPVVMATAFVQEGGPGASAASGTERAGAEPESAEPSPATGPDATRRPGPRRLLTWRNAVLGGMGAFALLGVIMGGWMASRALGVGPAATLVARGVFDERATVVLADFSSTDGALARAATEAFRIDLSQSRIVRLADPGLVGQALSRMQRDPASVLDRETAAELAVREGLPAVIAGEILPAGGGYVFSAELFSAGDRRALASDRVTADSADVLDAIDELSKRLRERIGESVGRLRDEPPLKQVTTSNLAALRKYSQAYHALYSESNGPRGRALLEEAVALDTAFATAYAALGTHLANLGEERELQVESFERAYRHRDRLTEEERYSLTALYYSIVLDEPERAVTAFESLLELDPDNAQALANLGDKYLALRDYARVEELNRRSIEIDSANGVPYWNTAEAQARLGRFDEAVATIRAFLPHSPGNPFVSEMTAQLRASRGEYEAAEEIVRETRAAQLTDPFWRVLTSVDLAGLSAVRGRVGAALRHLEEAAAANRERGMSTEMLRNAAWAAMLDARVLGDRDAARVRLEAALSRTPLSELAPLDRPYAELAEAFASAGDAARARRLMSEMEEAVREDIMVGGRYPQFKLSSESPDRARGEIALREGDHDAAIRAFRSSDAGYCRLCALPGLARAYDAAGRVDSALAVFERFIELPGPFRLWTGDAIYRGPALERLAQLYAERGDLENAAKYYAMFVELWADADDELQPRVRAAQARLEKILRQRG